MNKRRNDRIGKRLFVRFGKEKPDKVGFTEDVSETGLFIKTNTVFNPGTHLKLELTLPDEKVIQVAGLVMWAKQVPQNLLRFTKKCGMGVRLTQNSEHFTRFVAMLNRESKGAGP